jgi:nitroimidazol reductase NimA-like FMN-containing flavoprotein (pyridoxamine 5'-phosphate oxidase superfamily)
MRLIANLATLDKDGSIHLMPMWFLRIDNDICIPTSRNTHKYRNLVSRPRASVMIDISRAGLNLKGVLIKGQVELVVGEEARKINRLIHLKYVMQDALDDTTVNTFFTLLVSASKIVKVFPVHPGYPPLLLCETYIMFNLLLYFVLRFVQV